MYGLEHPNGFGKQLRRFQVIHNDLLLEHVLTISEVNQ